MKAFMSPVGSRGDSEYINPAFLANREAQEILSVAEPYIPGCSSYSFTTSAKIALTEALEAFVNS